MSILPSLSATEMTLPRLSTVLVSASAPRIEGDRCHLERERTGLNVGWQDAAITEANLRITTVFRPGRSPLIRQRLSAISTVPPVGRPCSKREASAFKRSRWNALMISPATA